MTAVDELVPWLREQIAEKRRRAMRTEFTPGGGPAVWTYERRGSRVMTRDAFGNPTGVAHRRAGVGTDGEPYDDIVLDVDGEHMELNDPQAAVAECEAHEALLDEHWNVNEGDCYVCVDAKWGYPTHGGSSPQRFPCKTIRIVALAYQHRPGYREEWRP